MCLARVFDKKERDAVLDKLPDEFTVWKIICDWGKSKAEKENRYTTDCRGMTIHGGEVRFKTNTIESIDGQVYRGGGHFWLYKQDAEWWRYFRWPKNEYEKIIRCRVKKEWITNMGRQLDRTVVVVKRAVFPKYLGQAKNS